MSANFAYDSVYKIYAYRENSIRIVTTQGEGTNETISELTDQDLVKAPQFQLRDEKGIIDISSLGDLYIELAIVRPNKTEDLLDCTIIDSSKSIIACPIRQSLTEIPGEVKGEIRLITPQSVVKFCGINFYVYKGISDEAAEQSVQFTDLISALQQVGIIVEAGSTGTVSMDTVIQENGTQPVSSGIIYDYLANYYTKTETDGFLLSKENVSNKVDDIDTECTDEQYPAANAVKDYLNTYYYDASDTEDRFQFKLEAGDNVTIEKAGMYTSAEKISVNLDSKYDASNVETGSGELTVYSEDMPIPSATFAYQRTGDFVTVALSIEFSQAEMGKTKSYQLLGLPYKNDIATRQATITNNKNKLTVAIGVGTSTLTVLTQGEAVNFSQKEFITDTITYKIRK